MAWTGQRSTPAPRPDRRRRPRRRDSASTFVLHAVDGQPFTTTRYRLPLPYLGTLPAGVEPQILDGHQSDRPTCRGSNVKVNCSAIRVRRTAQPERQ